MKNAIALKEMGLNVRTKGLKKVFNSEYKRYTPKL